MIMIYKLEVNAEELNLLSSALSNLPYGQVALLIEKLHSQVITQENAAKQEPNLTKIQKPEE